MNKNYRDVRSMAQIQLSRRAGPDVPRLTSEDIRHEVQRMIAVTGAQDVDLEEVVRELESSFATVVGNTGLLQDRESWQPWLPKQKASIPWKFWERYWHFLVSEVGWAPATLEKLDESTDQVLGLMTEPTKEGSWDRRGMVVGDVQSGKTSHYIGLTCKAADAGYKLIIVLAGFHNSLRSQTQIRFEEGFLGYDWGATAGSPEATARPVGVGLQDLSVRADTITTRANDGDFRRQVANNFAIRPGGRPLLFVVKKNSSVLGNLLAWVRGFAADEGHRRHVPGVPLLVIDDEADQGSVDTGLQEFDEEGNPDREHDPKPINRHIRKLLHLFDQSAYVGYTATPFANIFIHEKGETQEEGEDLFPRSFIISLPTPSNHVGPAKVFGYETDDRREVPGLPTIRDVDDHAESLDLDERSGWMPPKHKKEHLPRHNGVEEVPPSLRKAIHSFILVCAARQLRGQGKAHNSMLVHVTRFTAVQEAVQDQIVSELTNLRRRLRFGEGQATDRVEEELRKLWEEDFIPTTDEIRARGLGLSRAPDRWETIRPLLLAGVESITVRQINGLAGEVLDYVEHKDLGLNVIAVGGDKLSRGLTLEGLTISYFLRASKMYDTLMQMGRWFGYREGYLDLCRLYTTDDMADWFSHIARASDELREDFDRMVAGGGTPRDFGHRVRSHPTLLVTSRVKMRHGQEIDLTYDGSISETINFWRDRDHLARNWAAATDLLEAAEGQGKLHPARRAWKSIAADPILAFLRAYTEHDASKRVKTGLLADYIEAEVRNERLTSWTVLLASGDGREEEVGSQRIQLVKRSWHEPTAGGKEDLKAQNHYRIRRLVNPPDEFVDLREDQISSALQETVEDWERDPTDRSDPSRKRPRPDIPSGIRIREARPAEHGLLLIYPLDGADDEKVESDATDIPVIGFGISFPFVQGTVASRVRYTVSNLYYQQEVRERSAMDSDRGPRA